MFIKLKTLFLVKENKSLYLCFYKHEKRRIKMIKNCICGRHLKHYRFSENTRCNHCSSIYNKEGDLILSRHNWNAKDFFQLNEDESHKETYKKHLHSSQP
jgi:hypothetical protein